MPRGHSNRLLHGRFSEPGRVYHVTMATAGRRLRLLDLQAGRQVVRALRAEADATTLCFCLMPDHLHWLLQLADTGDLSRAQQRVKGRSARWVGAGAGNLWQDGYHDHGVRRDEDLPALARYIVANPLRAGVVTRLGDYPLWERLQSRSPPSGAGKPVPPPGSEAALIAIIGTSPGRGAVIRPRLP